MHSGRSGVKRVYRSSGDQDRIARTASTFHRDESRCRYRTSYTSSVSGSPMSFSEADQSLSAMSSSIA